MSDEESSIDFQTPAMQSQIQAIEAEIRIEGRHMVVEVLPLASMAFAFVAS